MSTDPTTLDRLRIDRSQAPRSSFPWKIFAAVSVLMIVIGSSTIWWINRPRPVAVHTVVARTAGVGSSQVLLNASGYVTARRAATVSSKVTGKVIEVLTEEGKEVEMGQVLARVDASNTEASLKLAEAQLESTRKASAEIAANLGLSENDLRRSMQLREKNVVSEADLERAQTETSALRARLARQLAEVTVAERQVALWTQQLDDTIIRAPFSGVVTSKNAQPGEMISPMSAGGGFTRTGICTLVDMKSLEIEVDVNESYINRVIPDMPATATLDSYPDWKIPANVIAIIPTADRQKASVKVRVGFVKLDPRILPDMGVKVAFEGATTAASDAQKSVVLIPAGTVRSRDGHDVVFVVVDGRIEQRAIRVGARQGEDVAVNAGLSGGETLVLDPSADLGVCDWNLA
jgi:RND family efflux transporter MFP subunit